ETLDVGLVQRPLPRERLPADEPRAVAVPLPLGDLRQGCGEPGGVVDRRHTSILERSAARDVEHDLAVLAAGGQPLERIPGTAQRKRRVDLRTELAAV